MTGPAFVFVHGGATTSRCWDLLLPHLPGLTLAVDLPGRLDRPGDLDTLTVAEGAASMVADVEAAGLEEIVLVAHSSGGLEVPQVVEGLGADRVRAIVLNAASVPPEGGSGMDCMQARHREAAQGALDAAHERGIALSTPRPEPEALRRSSGEELDDEQLAFVAHPDRSVADSFNIYLSPVHWSLTAGIPTTYIVNLRDRAVPVDLQREMAARLPGRPTIVDLDSGHLPFVTHPTALAALIVAAVPA